MDFLLSHTENPMVLWSLFTHPVFPVFISKVFGHETESQIYFSPFISLPIILAHSYYKWLIDFINFSHFSWMSLKVRNSYFLSLCTVCYLNFLLLANCSEHTMTSLTLMTQYVLCMIFAVLIYDASILHKYQINFPDFIFTAWYFLISWLANSFSIKRRTTLFSTVFLM